MKMYDEDFAMKRIKAIEKAYDEECKNKKVSTTGEEIYVTRYVSTRQTRGYVWLRHVPRPLRYIKRNISTV